MHQQKRCENTVLNGHFKTGFYKRGALYLLRKKE
jgi:hypothetical protein